MSWRRRMWLRLLWTLRIRERPVIRCGVIHLEEEVLLTEAGFCSERLMSERVALSSMVLLRRARRIGLRPSDLGLLARNWSQVRHWDFNNTQYPITMGTILDGIVPWTAREFTPDGSCEIVG